LKLHAVSNFNCVDVAGIFTEVKEEPGVSLTALDKSIGMQ